jgi:hypothetical protein
MNTNVLTTATATPEAKRISVVIDYTVGTESYKQYFALVDGEKQKNEETVEIGLLDMLSIAVNRKLPVGDYQATINNIRLDLPVDSEVEAKNLKVTKSAFAFLGLLGDLATLQNQQGVKPIDVIGNLTINGTKIKITESVSPLAGLECKLYIRETVSITNGKKYTQNYWGTCPDITEAKAGELKAGEDY